MTGVVIRPVEKFPQPEFGRLQREVFADIQQCSGAWGAVLEAEAEMTTSVEDPSLNPHPPMRRLGAFDENDELVGWSFGWLDRGNCFLMANSGVAPSRRRQGIYTALLDEVCKLARSLGAIMVHSNHSVANNPILIAKLRYGFQISGLSQSAQMGTLVELTYHFSEPRKDLFRARVLPYVAESPDGA